MKKRYCAIALTAMSSIMLLSGCSKQINLETALANSQNIKSYAYDLNVSVNHSNPNKDKETKDVSPASALLKDGKLALDFNGQVKDTGDRVKLSSNIKVISPEDVLKDPIPIYIDSAKKGFDFNLFVGVPAPLKTALGDSFKKISTVYVSSKDLSDFIKETQGEDAYKKFQESANKDNSNDQVSKDMLKVFNDYINKNKDKVEKFQKIEKLSASENGTYTITLSKDDLKAIASNYLNNPEYFKNFKDTMNKSSEISSVKDGTSAETDELKADDAKTMIDKVNKSLDEYKEFSVVTTFTIKDKLIYETDVKITTNQDDDVLTIDIDNKISDVNKIDDIKMPDKDATSTLNIMKLYNQMSPATSRTTNRGNAPFDVDDGQDANVSIDDSGNIQIK